MSLKEKLTAFWARLKQRFPWIVHTLRAYKRLTDNHGNHYAAAITYFSFLALFPLLLLGVSILGFVLHSHPDLQRSLLDKVSTQAPGGLGDTLKSSITSAVNARAGLGVVGLLGVVLTGAGWISNLRAAIDNMWGVEARKRNFLKAKVADLVVLGGLGVGIIVSLGLTAVGTALTDRIVQALGLDALPGTSVVLKLLGIALGVLGDMLIFAWVLVRLPQVDPPRRVVIRGVLLAAIGFEILKVVGTYTIAASAHSATAGPFGSILAVLIWIQLVSRFMLFAVAWMAESLAMTAESEVASRVELTKPAAVVEPPVLSPLSVAGTLIGAGAAAGGGVVAWATHRRRVREQL